MKILCGTDFSESADAASRAAARIAARAGTQLHLVHVVASAPASATARAGKAAEIEQRRKLLRERAGALRELGAKVEEELLEGAQDDVLIERARALDSALIVIGPFGEHRGAPWGLGGLAMRLIKGAHVPVMVVRDERSLAAWSKGERPLRALVGLDRTHTSRAALAWTREIARAGPLEIVAGHVYSPAEASQRYSLVRDTDPARDVARIEAAVAGELGEHLKPVAGLEPRLKLLAGWGRVSYHLLDLADAERADLLVIGTHRRQGLERLWRGSVSLDLAAHAKCNVLTVPSVDVGPRARAEAREIRRVLVPCDLSEGSGRAVAWACALLARGGTLHVLHVTMPAVALAPDFGGVVPLPPPTGEELATMAAEIRQKLRVLVPSNALARDIETRFEIVTAFDAATAIVQAAERLEVDAICLTTHGRSGLSRALMGSVAESVLRHAHVPIFVLTPPRGAHAG